MRRQLLFVSPRFLFPVDQGGKVRTTGILRAMLGGAFEIVLASPAPPDWQAHTAAIGAVCDHFVSWPEPHRRQLGRLLALAGAQPVSVASDQSAAGITVVARALALRPDVVVVDFPHAAVLVPAALAVPSVLFTHNVEAEIFERHAAIARGVWKFVWQREARQDARFRGAGAAPV